MKRSVGKSVNQGSYIYIYIYIYTYIHTHTHTHTIDSLDVH